jgi:hypothetical protein
MKALGSFPSRKKGRKERRKEGRKKKLALHNTSLSSYIFFLTVLITT